MTFNPKTDTVWPAVGPSTISFSSSGTFIYCNNPEILNSGELGDSNISNKYLLSSYVTGNCQVFYSHTNNTGYTINYGIQIYNPGPDTVTLVKQHNGFSEDPIRMWAGFFKNNPDWVTILSSGQSFWLMTQPGIPNGCNLVGACRFQVLGGSVYVFNYAYQSLSQIDGSAEYTGFVTGVRHGADQGLVYKGTATGYLKTAGIVYDCAQGPKVYRTNHCQDGNADMLTIYEPDGNSFSCAKCSNLGNWGVQYLYRVSIRNAGSNTELRFKAKPGPLVANAGVYYVDTPDGHGGQWVTPGSVWHFLTVPLPRTRLSFQTIVCAQSEGDLEIALEAR